uniref:Putative secreted protein n=1 Tax=Anopheles marajoara TaxID=58244 RepID=A0A2M4C757_9DIPT
MISLLHYIILLLHKPHTHTQIHKHTYSTPWSHRGTFQGRPKPYSAGQRDRPTDRPTAIENNLFMPKVCSFSNASTPAQGDEGTLFAEGSFYHPRGRCHFPLSLLLLCCRSSRCKVSGKVKP